MSARKTVPVADVRDIVNRVNEHADNATAEKCPKCGAVQWAPLNKDPFKRGCYSCGWLQERENSDNA